MAVRSQRLETAGWRSSACGERLAAIAPRCCCRPLKAKKARPPMRTSKPSSYTMVHQPSSPAAVVLSAERERTRSGLSSSSSRGRARPTFTSGSACSTSSTVPGAWWPHGCADADGCPTKNVHRPAIWWRTQWTGRSASTPSDHRASSATAHGSTTRLAVTFAMARKPGESEPAAEALPPTIKSSFQPYS